MPDVRSDVSAEGDDDPEPSAPASGRDAGQIREIVRPLFGIPGWDAHIGHGSFLTIEFGEEREYGRPGDGTPWTGGAWHLWVYCSAWRVETPSAILGACEDTREQMGAAAAALNGRAITAIHVSWPSLETTFSFEGDHTLRVFPIYSGNSSEDPHSWWLFTPSRMLLTVGPGSTCAGP